jgi:hypothetical protein
MAREAGVSKLVPESDCQGVVTKLRNRNLDRSIQGPLIEEAKALLDGFDDHQVVHVKRSFNEVAHRLAKDGCENKVCKS